MTDARRKTGLTLFELLITIALISILVAWVMPNADPAVRDQLVSAAQIVAGDLAYGRSLAITSDDKCTYTFSASGYTLKSSSGKTLPQSLFSSPTNPPPTQYVVDFGDLPHLGPKVKVYVAGTGTVSAVTPIANLEFGTMGELTGGQDVFIWLTAGAGTSQRYGYLQVDHVTGLTSVGPRQTGDPELYSASPPAIATSH